MIALYWEDWEIQWSYRVLVYLMRKGFGLNMHIKQAVIISHSVPLSLSLYINVSLNHTLCISLSFSLTVSTRSSWDKNQPSVNTIPWENYKNMAWGGKVALDHSKKKSPLLLIQNPDSCLTAGENPWSHGCLNVTTCTLVGRLLVQSAHYMLMSWNTDSEARGSNCQLGICCRRYSCFR